MAPIKSLALPGTTVTVRNPNGRVHVRTAEPGEPAVALVLGTDAAGQPARIQHTYQGEESVVEVVDARGLPVPRFADRAGGGRMTDQAGNLFVGGRFTQSIQVGGGAQHIVVSNGRVQINGVDVTSGGGVSAGGTQEVEEADVDIEVRVPPGVRVSVLARVVDAEHHRGDLTVRDTRSGLRVLGHQGGLDATALAGAVEVDGFQGSRLQLRATSSDVRVRGAAVAGALGAETASGGIELHDVTAASVAARRQSGHVTLEGLRAEREVDVHTMSGAVDGSGVQAPSVQVRTMSGAVDLDLAAPADVHVETMSGAARVGLSAGSAYQVRATSMSGGVRQDVLTGPAGRRVQVQSMSGRVRVEHARSARGRDDEQAQRPGTGGRRW